MMSRIYKTGELLNITSEYLSGKQIENPRLTAEVLLAHQLEIDRVTLYLHFDKPLNGHEVDGFRSLVKRRVNREPLQYITGRQEFWSLEFHVDTSVLIPRPESELLVELTLDRIKSLKAGKEHQLRILDLGTGSGALAVSIASEVPSAAVWATDVSGQALETARINAEKHGVSDSIQFREGDLWEPVLGEGVSFDIIVSNPPYVSENEFEGLPAEIRDHEPRLALYGYSEGMFFIGRIIEEGWKHLNPGGYIFVEMAPDQTEKALGLTHQIKGYEAADRIKDYSGRYRVVSARKVGPGGFKG